MEKNYTAKEISQILDDFLAGGSKVKLLESVIDLNLPELLAGNKPLSASEISNYLGLNIHRATKWLELLSHIGLISEFSDQFSNDKRYTSSPFLLALFGTDGKGGFYYKDHINYWRNVACLNLVTVLRGMPLPEAVKWPPKTQQAMEHLSLWMRITSEMAVQTIEKAINLSTISKVLDVGGNDATLACNFARRFPNIEITVFDIPLAINMAKNNVSKNNLFSQIKLLKGDFTKDPLPAINFDLVLFSRVLADWPYETCKMLLEKAKKVLKKDGMVLICEPFIEDNINLTTSWEYRYLFYDDFGVGVYKYSKTYLAILDELGFDKKLLIPPDESTIHGVIVASKV